MQHLKSNAAFALLCIVMLMVLPGEAFGQTLSVPLTTITASSTPLPEGADFATSVLRDPWDMSEFSDISQYLNESGQRDLVRNVAVANGLFNGTSVGDAGNGNTAYFFPLFPGYQGAIHAGKVGSRYPIPKSINKCLYFAMQVNSGPANGFGPDQFRIFWFADDLLNGGVWGQTAGVVVYPEAGGGQPVHSMRLYSVNLSTAVSYGTAWNDMPSVQGIRIDPTINANIDFSVDWVRLTDCAPVNTTITWTGGTASDQSIWLRSLETNRDIRVATGINGTSGSSNLDVQGIAPGSYYVGLGTYTTCCSQMNTSQALVINQAPIASFIPPTYFSQTGYRWSFSDSSGPSDVTGLLNFNSTSIQNGELNMVTASGPQPSGVDVQIKLNTLPINPAAYRYLTFRMSSQNGSAPWQNVVDGMIARLVWTVQGYNGVSVLPCDLVSQDIPYDAGYQTYSIDLYNAFNGQAEEVSGDCAGLPTTWQASGPILALRFDPNENISCNPQFSSFPISTCGDYVQKLDWIQLSSIYQVVQGSPFPLQLMLNDLPATVTLTYFYTTAPGNSVQFRARLYSPPRAQQIQTAIGTSQLFLPVIFNNLNTSDTFPQSNVTYMWDTAGVPPGTYYLCVQANDGYNTAPYCSESPIEVVAP